MKQLFIPLFAILFAAGSVVADATEVLLWQGSKSFGSWSDVLDISGSKFSKAKADDVLRLSITASDGAQLQLSWGSSWTCFDGLEALSVGGDYDLLLGSQDAARLRQGLHIKGVNYTLTAVSLLSNDGEYTTQSEELFAWEDVLLSGASQGQTCTIALQAYGGAGWYWPETVDMSSYGTIVVQLLQPAAETLTVQLLYGETGVKRQTIAKGGTQCKIVLNTAHKKVYSVNMISEKAQTVSIGSVELTDKQGNVVPAEVVCPEADGAQELSRAYYNAAGVRLRGPQSGINIVKSSLKGGRTIIRKELR